jgi:hypothetical protein
MIEECKCDICGKTLGYAIYGRGVSDKFWFIVDKEKLTHGAYICEDCEENVDLEEHYGGEVHPLIDRELMSKIDDLFNEMCINDDQFSVMKRLLELIKQEKPLTDYITDQILRFADFLI